LAAAGGPDGLARLASVLRGPAVESVHLGAVAVVAPDGSSIAFAGAPDRPTVVRSAVKPFQLLPLVLAGGIERFGLDGADLALISASHGGTAAHVERVRSLLERGGLGSADLRCGAHLPMDAEAAAVLTELDLPPNVLHNNCSGKHAGMLLACRVMGFPTESYLETVHPLQRRIVGEIGALCALEPESIPVAIDGCSAPTFELPLSALARGFAALAAPEAAGTGAGRAAALERIAAGIAAAPEMIAGPGRFTTDLIRETGGRILGKEGAEGVYAMAIRGPSPCGVALKIADGNGRARDTVAIEILVQLGALSGEEVRALEPHYRPTLRNWRGIEVGRIVADVELATSS